MDFTDILNEPAVASFLQDIPRADWKETLKQTLLYGIHSLKALNLAGFHLKKSARTPIFHPVPQRQTEFKESSEKSGKATKIPTRCTSHSKIRANPSESHACHKAKTRSNKSVRSNDNKLPPKRLIGREIKTQREQKSERGGMLGFKSEAFEVDTVEKKFREKPDNVACAKNVGERGLIKVLHPVEIPQKKHRHNFSSISAQIFGSSSDLSD